MEERAASEKNPTKGFKSSRGSKEEEKREKEETGKTKGARGGQEGDNWTKKEAISFFSFFAPAFQGEQITGPN